MRRLLLLAGFIVTVLVLGPSAALAADGIPPESRTLMLPSDQVVVLLVGAAVPLVTYILNHHAPWASEHVKAIVLVVVSAVAGALYDLAVTGGLTLDDATLQLCLSAVIAALAAHKLLWNPSGISARLGGGSNAPLRRT